MLSNSNELLGKALGTCTLQRLLGRGGMGAVYLAQQSRPRRTVAVKVLLPDLVLEERPREEFLARFRREADAIAALDHINIMPIYEYGEQGDTAYLVMPYVTGGTLREVLERRGKLPLEEALTIIEQAAAGLDSAHDKNIIHRDLKPGNILFHADGRVLIADFGLAKVLSDVAEYESKGHFLTNTGTIVGTPEYLSPEQSTGNKLDRRTDVYSLGIVLFHMLAGRVPFTGFSPVAVAIKHTLEAPPSLAQFNPDIPTSVEEVVMKAITKAPQERYESAGAFAHALREAVMNAPTQLSEKPYSQPEPPLHPEPDAPTILESHQTFAEEGKKSPTSIEGIASLSTHFMQPHASDLDKFQQMAGEDLHGSTTEAAPRLAPGKKPVVAQAVVTIEPMAAPPQPAPPVKRVETRLKRANVELHEQQDNPLRPSRPPRGRQPIVMLLIGVVLTFVIIGSIFAAYLRTQPTGSSHSNSAQKNTPLVTRGHTPQPSQVPTTSVLQSTPVLDTQNAPTIAGPIGATFYNAVAPGAGCDSKSGTWSKTPDTTVTCSTTSSQISNSTSAMNHITGTFLDQLPASKPMPANFVVQVQINVNASPQGAFGLVFRAQPGSPPQGGYAFLLNPASKSWGYYTYTSSGQASQLATSPLQAELSGTLNVEIAVREGMFSLYINGKWEGNGMSLTYDSGNIGFTADASANVAFKNLVLYTLP